MVPSPPTNTKTLQSAETWAIVENSHRPCFDPRDRFLFSLHWPMRDEEPQGLLFLSCAASEADTACRCCGRGLCVPEKCELHSDRNRA